MDSLWKYLNVSSNLVENEDYFGRNRKCFGRNRKCFGHGARGYDADDELGLVEEIAAV